MSSSRDVIICKQAAFGVAMGNAGEEVKRKTNTVNGRAPTTPWPKTVGTLMTDSRTPGGEI
jgi:hypothetical protein